MTIETKFEIGDKAFYINNSLKISEGTIFGVEETKLVSLGDGFRIYPEIKTEINYKYWLRGESGITIKESEYLFKTKEELIQSL